MPILYAQPYNIAATGFYFDSTDAFTRKAMTCVSDYGEPVEEFEIQFIDGDEIDCALAGAWGLYQSSFGHYLKAVDAWDDFDKRTFVIAVGECGYDFDPERDHPDDLCIDIYEADSLREMAEQFVDEGLYGDIPEPLRFYIDYDAIARDLRADYTQTTIAGLSLVYRCG